jgi:hypothetical protein
MRSGIMAEWLYSFYRHISKERQVLLLLDNFSAHILGLELAPAPPNIKVIFFPANATSIYQPLDQGIIQNLKHQYRKKWMLWMINILDRGLDPQEKMSLNYTLRWITQAWRGISEETTQNCFTKSTVVVKPVVNLVVNPVVESLPTENLGSLYNQVINQLGGSSDTTIPLNDFLDPPEENYDPEPDQSDIILDLSDKDEDDEDQMDEYIFGPPPELPSSASVISSMHDALLWVQHKDKGTLQHVRQLEGLISDFTRLQVDERKQRTLDGFLKGE